MENMKTEDKNTVPAGKENVEEERLNGISYRRNKNREHIKMRMH
jgi:hypothetical protein